MRSRLRGLVLAGVSVALAFAVVLSAAFWLSFHAPNLAHGTAFGAAAALAIAIAAVLIARAFGIPFPIPKGRAPRGASSPGSAVPLPTDEYARNVSMTLTCRHLEPIESAMRAAGIAAVPVAYNAVRASCRIHNPSLRRRFPHPEFASYRQYFDEERSAEDTPVAQIYCAQCRSSIHVYHPALCTMNTPWFPEPPPPLTPVANHWFPSHADITAIACSPSGKYAAIAAGTHETPQYFSIWDAEAPAPLLNLPAHGVIRSIAWSADEKTLATSRGVLGRGAKNIAGPSLFLWDVRSGAELRRFGSGLFGVRGVAFSPDGRFLLASGMLGETPIEGSALDLWEIATGRHITRFAQIGPNGAPTMPMFHAVAFTPDGSLALAACNLYMVPTDMRRKRGVELPPRWNLGIRAWSLSTGQEVDFITQPAPITTFSISADGTRFFFAGGRFGMWDLTKRWLVWDQQNSFAATAVSPGFDLIARGRGYRVDSHGPYDDTGVELFESNGSLLSIARHQTPVSALAMTPHSRGVIAGGEQGELRFWKWLPPEEH